MTTSNVTINVNEMGQITNEASCRSTLAPGDSVIYTINNTSSTTWKFTGTVNLSWVADFPHSTDPHSDFVFPALVTNGGLTLQLTEQDASHRPALDNNAHIGVSFGLTTGTRNAAPDPVIINKPQIQH